MSLSGTQALVSVVIPVYNRSEELQRAITSVLSQTYQNIEVLVVDDGSEENLKSICDGFDDKRIRFFKHENHTNANVARNRGIKEAKGIYIAMLDSDDEFLPFHIEKRLQKIEKWNCGGIFGSAYINDGEKLNLALSRNFKSGEKMIDYLLSDGFASTPSHFYKRSAALSVMWDEDLKRHQDWDFSVRFASQYQFLCDYEPSVIIHWAKGDKRSYDFDSQIRFIEMYKSLVRPDILLKHFMLGLNLADTNMEYQALKYYRNEIKKLVFHLPLSEWLLLNRAHNGMRKIIYLFKFFLLILCDSIKRLLRK